MGLRRAKTKMSCFRRWEELLAGIRRAKTKMNCFIGWGELLDEELFKGCGESCLQG